MSKLAIGLLTPAWPGFETPNGIATSVYQLALGLRAIGHTPVILAHEQDAPAPEGIPVFPVIRRPWSLRQKIAARLGRWGDVLAETTGDAIADAVEAAHAAHGLDAVLVEETQGWAHRVARRGRVPVIVVLHGPWILYAPIKDDGSDLHRGRAGREARGFASAVGILAPSRNVLAAVEGAINLEDKPRAVIPNALAPGPAPVPPADGPVLFVGRFDRHKGGDTVLDAFSRLHATRPDARLTFAGPDRGVRREDGTILTMETALSVLPSAAREALTALGRQGAGEIAALRRTHPIALIASRYENLNYTMLEAMAAGQAIVSTNVGGPAEVFEHGKTALLVPPADPRAMADALLRLMAEPALARSLGAGARARLAEGFAPEVIARETVAFLTGCLETSA